MLLQGEDEHAPEKMALLAQRCWRGYISRKRTTEMRIEELVFIGMAPPPPRVCPRSLGWPLPLIGMAPRSLGWPHPRMHTLRGAPMVAAARHVAHVLCASWRLVAQAAEDDPKRLEREVKGRRKLIQAQHEQEYKASLVAEKEAVYETEGPDMKEEMMVCRRQPKRHPGVPSCPDMKMVSGSRSTHMASECPLVPALSCRSGPIAGLVHQVPRA